VSNSWQPSRGPWHAIATGLRQHEVGRCAERHRMKFSIAAIALLALPLATLGAPPTTSFEAASVHVDQYGSGAAPLVLIPGLTDSGAVWDSTVTRYRASHTVYVLTLARVWRSPQCPRSCDPMRSTAASTR
jgi:pimeloyl-ACP methyl ester carboxylesterase